MAHKYCEPCDWSEVPEEDKIALATIALLSTQDQDRFMQIITLPFYGLESSLYSTRPDYIRDLEMSIINPEGDDDNE